MRFPTRRTGTTELAVKTCARPDCDQPVGRNRSKYCSAECAQAETAERGIARHEALRNDAVRTEQRAAASRRHYLKARADKEAAAKRLRAIAEWRAKNADKMAEQNRRWQIENADRVRAKIQRRRARLLDAFVEDVDPTVVWDRDDGVCGVCGLPIDRALAWPHKMSKTLDHIVPLARGGTHEYANMQLAHAVCNARKNDSVCDEAVNLE